MQALQFMRIFAAVKFWLDFDFEYATHGEKLPCKGKLHKILKHFIYPRIAWHLNWLSNLLAGYLFCNVFLLLSKVAWFITIYLDDFDVQKIKHNHNYYWSKYSMNCVISSIYSMIYWMCSMAVKWRYGRSFLAKTSQQLRCYARGERALLKLLGRDSLGVTAKLGAHALRSYI